MKIKKNDIVMVRAGKDRGKTGKVLRVYPTEGRIVVEGVNLIVKHVRSRRSGEHGQRMYLPGRMPVAKVQLVCSACGKTTRVGVRRQADVRQKRQRICKKCNAAI